MKNWYLIHSKPGKELAAANNLEMQEFHTYLPLISMPNVKSKPMFPRYLFVSLSAEEDNWSPIRSTPGVSEIVMFGGSPARATPSVIDSVREVEGFYKHKANSKSAFEAGDRIVVGQGSVFSGYEGVFCKYSSKDRVIVLLSVAERSLRLTIDQKLLRTSVH